MILNKKLYDITDFSLSTSELLLKMGQGWNLGNTLDGHHQTVSIDNSSIIDRNNYFETWYKNYPVTKEIIQYVKKLGFNSIRLPITWKDHIENGNIDRRWLEHIKEIVEWVLLEDMYCIINIHHDTIHYSNVKAPINASDELSSVSYLCNLWEQIGVYFKDYSSKLLFESMNETLNNNGSWSGTSSDYKVINTLNQNFVNVIRDTGGNNKNRFLIVPTYGAQVSSEIFSGFKMPNDIVSNKLICNVHIYATSVSSVNSLLSLVKSSFVDKNIPIMMNEYGVKYITNDTVIINEYIGKCNEYGIVPFYWDNGGTYRLIERVSLDCYRPNLINIITGVNVEKRKYNYPFCFKGMPYICKLYSSDSLSIYGQKYIVICSQYPITGFSVGSDESGYYKIERSKYGKMALFESDNDTEYTMLWNFLDNNRADYNKDKYVLGSTSNMKLLDSNYTITFSNTGTSIETGSKTLTILNDDFTRGYYISSSGEITKSSTGDTKLGYSEEIDCSKWDRTITLTKDTIKAYARICEYRLDGTFIVRTQIPTVDSKLSESYIMNNETSKIRFSVSDYVPINLTIDYIIS